jgi:L-aspartate oxidase
MKHVVVIGSGIAGLIAAVEAARTSRVTLLTKSTLGESNTHYAQGGIAAVTSTDDSIASHVADTLDAGNGLCWPPAVDVLCAEGPQRINDLESFGVNFDRAAGGDSGDFARGLEAAHSHARILHAGGDATGAGISAALVAAVKANVADIREYDFVADIVTHTHESGRSTVTGVTVLTSAGPETIEADAVILASGGAGQLYRHTTNPAVTTGDGVALAFRAGAVLADVEFYQFHPTALAVPGSFLISEAVRGEGAVLVNSAGERFMTKVDARAELAPRDIVARSIQREMLAQGGVPVLLDATALGADFLAKRFPSINAACARYGLDWARTPIPVTPAAHYWMGGVATDTFGRSSVEGLFAVGEVACTGTHGANRLASNSLLESVVFSHRAVAALHEPWPVDPPSVRWADQPPLAHLRIQEPGFERAGDAGSRSTSDSSHAAKKPDVIDRIELQTMMWDNVGLARDAAGLESARARIAGWRAAPVENRLFPDWEDANLLLLASAVTEAALAREESRGAHYRLDYPETLPGSARPIVLVEKGDS